MIPICLLFSYEIATLIAAGGEKTADSNDMRVV